MTPPITYKLELDTARDGTFAQDIDDITQYWVGLAQWNNGMGGSYEEVAPPARLTVQLSNRSGVFDLDYLGEELITNPDFDQGWSVGGPTGWSAGGNADGAITEVASNELYGGVGTGAVNVRCLATLGSDAGFTQFILTRYRTYLLTVVITESEENTGSNQSGVKLRMGLSTVQEALSGVGTYRFIRKHNNFDTGLSVNAYFEQACNVTVDSISLKEVRPYAMMNRGMQVRLRATLNGVTSTLFQGRISQIQSSAGRSTEPTISLTIEDAMLELLDAEYAPPLLIAPTVDTVLTHMFDDAVIRWPYSGSWWLLGVPGNSELEYTTYLYDHDVVNFETGITTFEYTGDVEDRGEGISAQGYVRDIVAAEAGGRFWFDTRTNKFKFHNRDHDPQNDTVAATYNESHFDSAITKDGEDIINDLTLSYTSRDVGSEGTVLWTLKSIPFLLKNGNKRAFNARYFDVNNEQLNVGARTTIAPVSGIDFTANLTSDGSGTDLSSTISVSVESSGNGAKITVFNNSGIDVYVTLLQMRGTPITHIEERYQTVDGASIAANELYPKSIEVRALDNTSLAEQFGNYVVAKFKDPIFRFETVTFNSLNGDTMTDASVNRVIGDKITITDASTNHDRDYIIVGEQNMLTIAGDHPRDVTWILKPAEREAFWVLEVAGKSELDQTTRLSF